MCWFVYPRSWLVYSVGLIAVFLLSASTYRLLQPEEGDEKVALGVLAAESLQLASRSSGSKARATARRIVVKCYRDAKSFEQELVRGGASMREAKGTRAYPGFGPVVHIRHNTCANAQRLAHGELTILTAGAMKLILHEGLHRQGLSDERVTECYAIHATKYAALLVKRLANGDSVESQPDLNRLAARALRLAFKASARWLHPSYVLPEPECRRLTSQESWSDYLDG